MVYGKASLYYVRYSVLGRCLRYTFTTFNPLLWLITIILLILFFINNISLFLFRLLDEIFYRKYHDVQIKSPVFIIANPRSGTTFLHRMMSKDEKRFTYMKFAHTLFCAATFVDFTKYVKRADDFVGSPITKLLNKMDEKLYAGWEDIHEMGFNKAEEDEALFAQSMMSSGIFVLFPFFHLVKNNYMLDNEPQQVRNNMMDFYESSLKRFVYARDKHKTYLAKNVNSSGRIQSILSRFPDAKIIFIARNPYKAVPSMVSMFSVMYGFHSPAMPKTHPTYKQWANCSIDFFKHFNDVKKTLKQSQFYALKYDTLIAQPKETVLDIYKHFDWEVSKEFTNSLEQESHRNKDYKSSHNYSLEEYGISKNEIAEQLGEVIAEYGFQPI